MSYFSRNSRDDSGCNLLDFTVPNREKDKMRNQYEQQVVDEADGGIDNTESRAAITEILSLHSMLNEIDDANFDEKNYVIVKIDNDSGFIRYLLKNRNLPEIAKIEIEIDTSKISITDEVIGENIVRREIIAPIYIHYSKPKRYIAIQAEINITSKKIGDLYSTVTVELIAPDATTPYEGDSRKFKIMFIVKQHIRTVGFNLHSQFKNQKGLSIP